MDRGPVNARPAGARAGRLAGLAFGGLLVASASLSGGCYAPQLALLKSGLDSLRTQVDTLQVRDAVTYQVLADTRREVAQQRDILLSTKATAGSTTQEIFDLMGRLEGKLDEAMHYFNTRSERSGSTAGAPPTVPPVVVPPAGGSTTPAQQAPPVTETAKPPVTVPTGTGAPQTSAPVTNPPAPPQAGPDPVALYDQSTQDLTQGRYGLALQGYREFLKRFPAADLADNAQYGAGECFFAQASFDSAATEYAKVPATYPKGDRVPAAMYKLSLCQERLGRAADARRTLEDLVRQFPNASESQLARDRLGAAKR